MLPEINTQLTNKVRQAEAHSFHTGAAPVTGPGRELSPNRSLANFLTFLLTFTCANILKSGKYVEKSSIHNGPCLSGHQLQHVETQCFTEFCIGETG